MALLCHISISCSRARCLEKFGGNRISNIETCACALLPLHSYSLLLASKEQCIVLVFSRRNLDAGSCQGIHCILKPMFFHLCGTTDILLISLCRG